MDLIKKYLEEQSKDTGWKPAQSSRKDKYGNPIKTANVARNLARQAMQSAVKDLKKGPEAGKRQVEEVELDEGVGGTIVGAAAQFLGNKIDPLHGEIMRTHGEAAGRAAEYTIRKHLNRLHSALKQHLSTGKAVTEETDLVSKYSEIDEAKYPGFRVRMTSMSPRLGPKLPRRGYGYVPQGDQDPRTGLPLGFSHPPKKDEPKKTEPPKN